jgi:hypothetical protein
VTGGRLRKTLAIALLAACCLADATVIRGQAEGPLDPIQRAVIDSLDASLAVPGQRSPQSLLAAALKAAKVEAPAAAERYLAELAALADKDPAKRLDLLADLGDASDDGALIRLERLMQRRQPAAAELVAKIREAGRLRRRDPGRLAAAVEALGSPVAATRMTAAEQVLRAGTDALPLLAAALAAGPADEPLRHRLAAGLVARLGESARQPLLDWLGSGDPATWADAIEALAASGADDIDTFLYAPAIVPGTPPEAQAAARRLLEARVAARGGDPSTMPPAASLAVARLADRLDRVLSPAGLPAIDHLRLEPVTDPAAAKAAFGGSVTGTVERLFWDPPSRAFERVDAPPRLARARVAAHLARDLEAFDAREPAVVQLILLTRLEAALLTAGDPLTVLERVPAAAIREALAGPDGFSAELAGDILEEAIERGLWPAAAAVAKALEPEGEPPAGPAGTGATLPPAVRYQLVRALAVPDSGLQFAAARTLALAAGDPPYRGSSRVVETLLYAATSKGVDRVVVAHPDAEVVHALAAGVSRFGYEPVRVSTGREAVFAARASADTVLVFLAARIGKPTAVETVDFLQQQGLGDIPPILVVVDPLDDDGRGKYLTRLLLTLCAVEGVGVIDRLESLFLPGVDPDSGEPTGPARFPDLLAQAAGPAAVDPATRNTAAAVRLARAREALGLLGRLAHRGQDVSPALPTALGALLVEELYAPAATLLAAIPRQAAQAALEQEARRGDLPEPLRLVARSAFEASVERWGLLLDSGRLLTAYARYNEAADVTTRGAAGGILDVIEAAGRKTRTRPIDASSLWQRR